MEDGEERVRHVVFLALLALGVLESQVLARLPVDLGGRGGLLLSLEGDLLDQLLVGEVRVLAEGLWECQMTD